MAILYTYSIVFSTRENWSLRCCDSRSCCFSLRARWGTQLKRSQEPVAVYFEFRSCDCKAVKT
jgi:hypothetical protein